MDPHPTPFPGKRRVITNPVAKPSISRPKSIKKQQTHPQQTTALQSRPKRSFGTVRSTNIPTEKPQLKPWKQPKPVAKPVKKSTITIQSTRSDSTDKKEKKKQHVQFVGDDEKKQEEAMRTPLVSTKVKSVETGTPYLSAQNCSKCRLDRLETSSYWLNQIRLAESVGKHFVSVAFFHLALECRAQPFDKIKRELKSYVSRHKRSVSDSLFDDLLQSYDLTSEKPKVNPNEFGKIRSSIHEIEMCMLKDEQICDLHQEGCLEIAIENLDCEPNIEQKEDENVQPGNCEISVSSPKEEQTVEPEKENSKENSSEKKFEKKSNEKRSPVMTVVTSNQKRGSSRSPSDKGSETSSKVNRKSVISANKKVNSGDKIKLEELVKDETKNGSEFCSNDY